MIQTALSEQMTHNSNTISERTSLIGLAHYNLHLGLGKQLGSVGFGVGGGHTVIQLRAHVVHVIRRDGHAELAAQHVPLAPHRALLLLRGGGGVGDRSMTSDWELPAGLPCSLGTFASGKQSNGAYGEQ